MSDITLVNKDRWRPVQRHKMERKSSYGSKSFECDTVKNPSRTPSVISRSRVENRVSSPLPDKLEEQKATAEMELSAKGCIESCAEFKLLFVPGYELDCPEQYYEDPVSSGSASCSMRKSSETSCDPFKSRFYALSKLEDETMSSEDRQKRFETMFCVSRYNGANKERRSMYDKRSQSSGSTQMEESLVERPLAIKSRSVPRTTGRKSRNHTGKKSLDSAEDIFGSARSSTQNLISECNELNFGSEMTSSEDTDSFQGNELKARNAPEQKPTKNTRKKKMKCNSSSDLKPSKFYDINQIAVTYTIPCEEKMKEGNKARHKNSSPGKSYFSQRKNSLTKRPVSRRPATAVVKKKKLATQKRPSTAIVDTRQTKKEVGD